MSWHWEGKECLPAFKVLPSPFPVKPKFSGHVHIQTHSFPECEELLEDHYNALSSLKTAQEAELNMLRRKVDIVVDFSNQRQVAAEG